ncbi:roadblock/LC7 domain-containing protein [Isoptericola sp. NEAU-Y5]|uniref:Roadblock/LC7 domain-containing protein n=1 Tax=Isoptericola luteus TaxID=2879484 RepID=A0ABS7ZJL4_9MICO|nr:roadblock/LC7 domain-containing protein [Isoptericola sp. NEAU-Y5]MCA5895210.1 roadblock/LC7 domain-containing protein [Isoptericola sp. NEAU-Y5]
MTTQTTDGSPLAAAHPDSWMLDLVAGVRGVRHVVVLSSDGLVKVRTDVTDPDTADKVAAACAGLVALGSSMGREFGAGNRLRQVLVEFEGGFLFVRRAGDGTRLAVVTDAQVDPGLVAQQMQAQVLMIGERTLRTDPAEQPGEQPAERPSES